MNTIEIKKDFHALIDRIDNGNLLADFYALLKKRSSSSDGVLWNSLNPSEQEELLISFDESQNSENLLSHKSLKEKHDKWL